MTKRNGFLGEFEQMLLLAILQLGTEAYGPDVGRELESKAGRRVSRGTLYSGMERLQKKGLLRWEIEAVTSERGGIPKRRFEVTADGVNALRVSQRALTNLKAGLEELLG
jgi:DNA-binding PadR family transcriptional regulator